MVTAAFKKILENKENQKLNGTEPSNTTTVPALTVDQTEALHYLKQAARKNLKQCMPFLKFRRGEFLLGADKELIPPGTKLIAFVLEARHGVEKWEGGKRTDEQIGKIASPFEPPDTLMLNANEPDKPWQHVVYLPMVTLTGETAMMLTVSTASGCEAFYVLIDRFGFDAPRHRGMMPVVALGTRTFNTKKGGEIAAPTFTITDWVTPPDLPMLAPNDAGGTDANEAESADVAWEDRPKPTNNTTTDMEDEIPF